MKSIQHEDPSSDSQKKTSSIIQVLFLSIAIIFVITLILEIFAQVQSKQVEQPIRSIGLFHTQFETKWFKLKDYVKTNGGVDVLLMGNSIVNTGIDPQILATQYESQTGVQLRFFNFGVEGLDLYTNSQLAALLVEEYHPKVIVFFTEMREYGPVTDSSVPDGFKTAAWFQYKRGHFNFEGWINDRSMLMQYLLPYRNWSRSDFPDTMLKDYYRYEQTTAEGYEPERAYSHDLDVRTDPNDPAQKPLFDLYRNFTPNQDNLNDLGGILALGQQSVQIVVSEMPVYKTYYDYFGGEPVHQEFLSTLQDLSTQHGAVFVTPIHSDAIPLTGRSDNHHLNFEGAPLYSQLLGQELASLCRVQQVCLANEVPQ